MEEDKIEEDDEKKEDREEEKQRGKRIGAIEKRSRKRRKR